MHDEPFNPYHTWLGISPLEPALNYYLLLGVRVFESDPTVLSNAADRQMAHIRTFQTGPRVAFAQQLLNEISTARVTLLDPVRKNAYDAQLQSLAAMPGPMETPTIVSPATADQPVKLKPSSSKRKKPSTNPVIEVVKMVVGGVGGLFMAVLLLSYFAGIDPLGWQKKPEKNVAVKTTSAPTTTQKVTEAKQITPPPKPVASESTKKVASVPTPPPPVKSTPLPPPSTPSTLDKTITNFIGMQFTLIPAGEFLMGSPNDEAGHQADETQHRVRITKPFYLGIYEVTQEQYERVRKTNPSQFKGPKNPVEKVSWGDASDFCRELSELSAEKLAGRLYRLPTEAEWEYAARAGSTERWSFGDDESRLSEYAWYKSNAGKTTHSVGQKKPNAWGLFDMHGNVWEWCEDYYDKNYYSNAPLNDPVNTKNASYRVSQGGGWDNAPAGCRSANRFGDGPSDRYSHLGFRVALVQQGAN